MLPVAAGGGLTTPYWSIGTPLHAEITMQCPRLGIVGVSGSLSLILSTIQLNFILWVVAAHLPFKIWDWARTRKPGMGWTMAAGYVSVFWALIQACVIPAAEQRAKGYRFPCCPIASQSSSCLCALCALCGGNATWIQMMKDRSRLPRSIVVLNKTAAGKA